MHEQYTETICQILSWAQTNPNIQGILMIGSQARSAQVSDAWSDLDLMILVNHPQALMAENTWFNRFGKVACFFAEVVPLEVTHWNWHVKRVLYEDHRDIDFNIFAYSYLDEVLAVTQNILSKGYQILYEACAGQIEKKVSTLLQTPEENACELLTETELNAVVNDLLFHVIWSFKKIKRKELWVAVGCINCYMRSLLLRLIEAYNVSTQQKANLLGYNGRFLEQRTDPEILERLEKCFTRYDPIDAVQTLQQLIHLIYTLASTICAQNGYGFDSAPFEQIQKIYDEMKENRSFSLNVS